MPKIRLTPEILQGKANELTGCMEDQRQIINDIAKLIDEVVADWEGQAQKKFIAAFNEAKPIYDKFADPDLRVFVDFLNNYALTMETLDAGQGTKAPVVGA